MHCSASHEISRQFRATSGALGCRRLAPDARPVSDCFLHLVAVTNGDRTSEEQGQAVLLMPDGSNDTPGKQTFYPLQQFPEPSPSRPMVSPWELAIPWPCETRAELVPGSRSDRPSKLYPLTREKKLRHSPTVRAVRTYVHMMNRGGFGLHAARLEHLVRVIKCENNPAGHQAWDQIRDIWEHSQLFRRMISYSWDELSWRCGAVAHIGTRRAGVDRTASFSSMGIAYPPPIWAILRDVVSRLPGMPGPPTQAVYEDELWIKDLEPKEPPTEVEQPGQVDMQTVNVWNELGHRGASVFLVEYILNEAGMSFQGGLPPACLAHTRLIGTPGPGVPAIEPGIVSNRMRGAHHRATQEDCFLDRQVVPSVPPTENTRIEGVRAGQRPALRQARAVIKWLQQPAPGDCIPQDARVAEAARRTRLKQHREPVHRGAQRGCRQDHSPVGCR
jgi:hypothetical protein